MTASDSYDLVVMKMIARIFKFIDIEQWLWGLTSLFLLNAVLRYHLETFEDEDTAFAEKLLEGFFVDDLITGAKTVKDAFSL